MDETHSPYPHACNYMYRLSSDIFEETQKSQQFFIHGESAAQCITFINEEPHTVL